jgi:hypothetical protein
MRPNKAIYLSILVPLCGIAHAQYSGTATGPYSGQAVGPYNGQAGQYTGAPATRGVATTPHTSTPAVGVRGSNAGGAIEVALAPNSNYTNGSSGNNNSNNNNNSSNSNGNGNSGNGNSDSNVNGSDRDVTRPECRTDFGNDRWWTNDKWWKW